MSQPIQPASQHSPAIYKLSETIIEEIVCYLPVSCYPSLALVSKAFSPRFRHRRIDTGTAIVPLQALGPVWNNPTLATFVREVTIHESFFGPKIEDVWALEREPEHVRVAAEKEAWILKAGLLTNVLENATNLRRIIVLGFPTGLSGAMPRLIIEMCKTSIKTLDVVADAHFFDAMESLHDDLNSIRNLTLRLGEGLHLGTLVDPGAGPDADPESLHTDLKSLRNLKLRLEEGFHLGTLVNRGVGLHADPDVNSEIDGTVIYSRMLRMLKKFPRLRSIRFYKARVDHSAPALLKEIKTDFPDLCEVVFDACIGLSRALSISHVIDNLEGCLVFRPLGTLGLDDAPDKVPGVSEDLKTCVLETGPSDFYVESLVEAILLRTPHMQSFGFCYTDLLFLSSPFWTRLRDPIIQSLSAMRLRSLSLCGPRKMGIDQ
ncbi:hypothetical protein BS47DRAFT_369637 [Hydnum rufescens UP504]|uniref:F-box domain-containing protein n=1 Tax=Hydnum rufescens UP504 TaxID=1448309 RepID=A0A9P6AJC8_9AGAM|nr:hypothetical protein BS47DRAFT_369637 [Hydnum rufescens UP504]